jgi:hypothetical protein
MYAALLSEIACVCCGGWNHHACKNHSAKRTLPTLPACSAATKQETGDNGAATMQETGNNEAAAMQETGNDEADQYVSNMHLQQM